MTGAQQLNTGWCGDAPAALRASLADLTGPAKDLLDEAADHVAFVLRTRAAGEVAAVAVPVAVFRALSADAIPSGLLAAAAATYVAFDVLDDLMDGDRPACWSERRPGELVIGTQILLVTAAQVIARGLPPLVAERVSGVHRAMLVEVADGQLRGESPLDIATTPDDVGSAIAAKSGALLGRLAEIAAVAAGADEQVAAAARRFGRNLGIARQHVNDLTELLGERTSDLRNGTATMVGAFALQGRAVDARQRLLDDLSAASVDPARRGLLRAELGPAIGEVCLLAQLHLGAARSAAEFVSGARIGHDGLAELIEHTAVTLRSNHGR
ncbi:MAG: hypothetical protein JWM12_1728 [Ilumatobacteraceae bacterium]|nr:hypothetical protein [Ilumatobacteraceae bacterium]